LPELILIAVVAALALGVVIEIAHRREARKTGKRHRTALSAGIGVMNEVFHPAASQAQIQIEEQHEARAPLPSPEDKK
jgi:type II secretory pathway pseudopilin PulG